MKQEFQLNLRKGSCGDSYHALPIFSILKKPFSQIASVSDKTPTTISPSEWSFTITLFLLCFLLGGEGCSGPFLYARIIHEDRDKYVKLEARYGHGQKGATMPFSQPIALSETEWAWILKSTYAKPRHTFLSNNVKEISPNPVFSESDLQYLARYVAVAFANAHPDEWVVFYLSHSQETRITEITSGGLFVEDSKIHLVLSNYRQRVTMPFIQQEIWNNPLKPAGEIFYDIVQQPHQTLHTDRRWDLTQSLLTTVSELEIDYPSLLILPPDKQKRVTSGPFQERISQGQDDQLINKLRMLRTLYEEGLITEREYQQKRLKLLEEL